MSAVNPIASIGSLANVPSPTTYKWSEHDISSPDAGRTEDAMMHKEFLAKKVKLELAWNYLSIAQEAALLQAVTASEYFQVNYLDAKLGTFTTKTFYAGDRTSPLYNATLGLWENVSFDLIEQ